MKNFCALAAYLLYLRLSFPTETVVAVGSAQPCAKWIHILAILTIKHYISTNHSCGDLPPALLASKRGKIKCEQIVDEETDKFWRALVVSVVDAHL